jgi:hypothetical protein
MSYGCSEHFVNNTYMINVFHNSNVSTLITRHDSAHIVILVLLSELLKAARGIEEELKCLSHLTTVWNSDTILYRFERPLNLVRVELGIKIVHTMLS